MSGDLPHAVGAQFQAKFPGKCLECGESVDEGDLMGYVDNTAVCDGCYNDADQENWAAVRAAGEAMRAAEQARDPEGYARTQAAVTRWRDAVKAKRAETPEHHEPPQVEEAPVGVEPGIQALMAAGLLQGQEPGGSGVCHAEIIEASGKVTEVAIPVPVDPPTASKARAPRKSRAKAGPEVPSASSVEDAAAAALARVREGVAAHQPELLAEEVPEKFGMLVSESVGRMFDTAPQPDALQDGLRAAVASGAMTLDVARGLGLVDAAPESPANGADLFHEALAAAVTVPEEDAVMGALDALAPYEGMAGGVEEAKSSILDVIEDAITNHPRSLQRTIGPSEIGTECDHCLAAKLAGWEQVRDGSPWLPTVGTAVHTWLEEEAFRRAQLDAQGRPRYLMERKVAVGTIGGVEITGSTDLVDLVRGITWDWKIVGATTLKSARVAPSRRYVIQQMLYARGWNRLGVLITHVGIAYLPRNDVSLRKAVLWTAPYDEELAVEALARADAIDANLKAMESLGVEARDNYITGLPRWRSWRENVDGIEKLVYGNAREGQIECLDCARYPDYPADPAQALRQLEGLL